MAIKKRLERRALKEIKQYGDVETVKKDSKHHYFAVFKHPIISVCSGGAHAYQAYRGILQQIKIWNLQKKEK